MRYYCFDIDDNLLFMPTIIHMERYIGDEWVPIDVSTSEFGDVRAEEDYRLLNNNADEAYCEFGDDGPRGPNAFMDDMKFAIDNKLFGPSWKTFIKCLSEGNIFALITARGNKSSTLRHAVEWIIDNFLDDEERHFLYWHCLKFKYLFREDYSEYERIPTGKFSENRLIQEYLNLCDFYPITSKECIDKFKLNVNTRRYVEIGKERAIRKFAEKIDIYGKKINAKVILGFSDDDVKNIRHIERLFRDELSLKYYINYFIFNTANRSMRVTRVSAKKPIKETTQSTGLESSVMRFSQFGNMTGQYYPKGPINRMDDYQNQFTRQSEYLAKTSKEIEGPRKKKRRRKKKKSI